MERDLISDSAKKVEKKVVLYGFINTRRDHGKIIFLDLRDATGAVQVVATPKQQEAYKTATTLGSEDVVKIVGKVNSRPKENVNPEITTGEIEVAAEKIELISKAAELPIPIGDEGYEIDEAVRFKNRHIDLRRERLQKNLKLRHKITKLVREFLDRAGFTEIETPYLSKSTPEGARDFLVPSRLQKGKFYALAQSPQQYKQLLMIAGFERYYQIARAFRDEDLRADRQFEHTQIDIEMAFVDREDVMGLVEKMIIFVAEGCKRKIDKTPFPTLSYQEAKSKYDTDRPNLAKNKDKLHFLWVKDFPLFEKTPEGGFTFAHNPFASPNPEYIEELKNKKNLEDLQSLQYDLVCNGEEVGGGSIRIVDPAIQRKVFEVMGYTEAEIEKEFGHLLDAYRYGAPLHGGIALGLDRLVSLIAGEDNIREVIAFPVTSRGQTSVMSAPSEVAADQLKELGLKTVPQQE
ncbi:MAG: aspartate--tRNA ligase [Candidatus Woykebacteria bacterium]